MATFILKSLGIGYALIALLFLILGGGTQGGIIVAFIGPIFYWPALLIVSGIVALVLRAIDEQKNK